MEYMADSRQRPVPFTTKSLHSAAIGPAMSSVGHIIVMFYSCPRQAAAGSPGSTAPHLTMLDVGDESETHPQATARNKNKWLR